jgi:hypothetical protein
MDRWSSEEAHIGTEVVAAGAALPAAPAGHARLQRHPLADPVAARLGSLGNHHPGGLVAQDEGSVDHVGADAAVIVVMDVGAADADGPDLDQHLLGAGLWDRDVLDAEITDAMQDSRSVPHRWVLAFCRARGLSRTEAGPRWWLRGPAPADQVAWPVATGVTWIFRPAPARKAAMASS